MFIMYHRAETFALVVLAVGYLLQLALVTTCPSLPYSYTELSQLKSNYTCIHLHIAVIL